jgi:hypothetical protein
MSDRFTDISTSVSSVMDEYVLVDCRQPTVITDENRFLIIFSWWETIFFGGKKIQ